MTWDEINQLIVLPRTPEERAAYHSKFGNTLPYSQLYQWSERINRNYGVFGVNCSELINDIDSLRNGRVKFGDNIYTPKTILEDLELRYQIAVRATRYLANFLGSLSALIDITRNLIKEIDNNELKEQYKQEVAKRYTANSEALFLRKLRNFAHHRAYPLFGPYLIYEKQGDITLVKFDMKLVSEDLLSWDEWGKELRGKIQEWSDEKGLMSIRDIVADYYQSQESLTIQILKSLITLHKTEYEEMNNLVRSLRSEAI